MRVFGLICFAAVFFGISSQAFAQSRWLTERISKSEARGEAKIQTKKRDYRLIRTPEVFPERLNATNAIMIGTDPAGAVVALHDRLNGSPLEACITPCKLHVDNASRYQVVAYKYGFKPYSFGLKNGGKPPYISLGESYFDMERAHRKCDKAFAEMGNKDRDAKPCLRLPPRMPARADRSGHCFVKFDIAKSGRPENIKVANCTSPYFKAPAKEAVTWWYFHPKVERGERVPFKGVKNKISFRLVNDGRLLDRQGNPVVNE